jgi:hypothetical protein
MKKLSANMNHSISKANAIKMIKRHRSYRDINGGFFGADAILKILNQKGCIGLRYYHAIDGQGKPTLVLLGESKNGSLSNGTLAENSGQCPPICPKNPLVPNTSPTA